MWVGFQSLFSAVLWNNFMINYNRILETDMPDILTGCKVKHTPLHFSVV
jgi:hypothetical protein